MEKTLYQAFINAINAVGVENFKRTSLFLSNEKVASKQKKAA